MLIKIYIHRGLQTSSSFWKRLFYVYDFINEWLRFDNSKEYQLLC